jgi:prefoldin subunit 4
MLTREEEVDVEVRLEDQEHINEFGRLNARLHEARGESDAFRKRLERIDDASTELMMANGGDKIHLLLGDAFMQVSEEEATEFCEGQVDKLQVTVDNLAEEMVGISSRQAELKQMLYGRFGSSINLEEGGPPA